MFRLQNKCTYSIPKNANLCTIIYLDIEYVFYGNVLIFLYSIEFKAKHMLLQ